MRDTSYLDWPFFEARHAQLASEHFVRFEQDNVKTASRGYKAAHHSGGSSADDYCVSTEFCHVVPPC